MFETGTMGSCASLQPNCPPLTTSACNKPRPSCQPIDQPVLQRYRTGIAVRPEGCADHRQSLHPCERPVQRVRQVCPAPWVHCAVKKNTGQRGQNETIDYLPVRIFQQIHLHIVDANRVVLSLCHRSSVDQ